MTRHTPDDLPHLALPPACRRFRAAISQALDDPAAAAAACGAAETMPPTAHEQHCESCRGFAMTMRRLHHEAQRWGRAPAPAPPDDFTASIMHAVQASRPPVRISGALLALLLWSCALAGGLLLARHLATADPAASLPWLGSFGTAAGTRFAALSSQVETYFGLPLSLADRGLIHVTRVTGSNFWWLLIALLAAAILLPIMRRPHLLPRRHNPRR